jgi:fibro-slime domain-containing protein
MNRTRVAAAVLATTLAAAAGADTVSLNATIRDFSPNTHADFQYKIATDHGIVASTIGVDRKPVYANPGGSTPTTHSKAQFDQWYNDVPGVNLAKDISITLDNGQPGPGGVYSYSNSSFFPIDNELLGNEGRSHNYHFTMELHAEFTHQAGLNFSFTGDDDLWVFINDALVIDLGGVHAAQSASVDLDTLGLTVGETYKFDLFFAERHTTQSNFNMETSIKLVPAPMTAAVPLAGLGLLSRRRRAR